MPSPLDIMGGPPGGLSTASSALATASASGSDDNEALTGAFNFKTGPDLFTLGVVALVGVAVWLKVNSK